MTQFLIRMVMTAIFLVWIYRSYGGAICAIWIALAFNAEATAFLIGRQKKRIERLEMAVDHLLTYGN
jgi:hypothetical protein